MSFYIRVFLQIDFCGMDVRMSHQNSDVIFLYLVIFKSATFKELEENNFVLTPGRYVGTD
ncbi:MAG: SAM-dependent methyltransferase [Saprospiraceae bacterium]|nr:SAM-dependent methyltransferase [Saprospiraceae bacterium]